MKDCIYLDKLKKDDKKVCRLFIDWEGESIDNIGSIIILETEECMCEMYDSSNT